eukprot:6207956-Lingulodinium_polyedra.AAC.1
MELGTPEEPAPTDYVAVPDSLPSGVVHRVKIIGCSSLVSGRAFIFSLGGTLSYRTEPTRAAH